MKISFFILILFFLIASRADCQNSDLENIIGSIHNEYVTYFLNCEKTTYHNEDYEYLPLHFIIQIPYPGIKVSMFGESDNYLFFNDSSSCIYMFYDYNSQHSRDTVYKMTYSNVDTLLQTSVTDFDYYGFWRFHSGSKNIFYARKDDISFVFFNMEIPEIKSTLQSFCVIKKFMIRKK